MGASMRTPPADSLVTAASELLLEGLEQIGLLRLPAARTRLPAPEAAPAAGPADSAAAALVAIAGRIAACQSCALCGSRTQVVPGEGSARARILFVGEAPGAEEDRTGRPFVGRAGQLLTRIIEDGVGLPRAEVYIANILKCRPPDNRDPLPQEKEACTPFLEEQIRILEPELLIALGRHAAGHLLGTDSSLSQLRGRLHTRPAGGPPVLVTYHPAYLLRSPAAKRDCWQDLQIGMAHLGLAVPQRRS